MRLEQLVPHYRAKVEALRGHLPRLSKQPGLDYSWICKFAAGTADNPTVRKLIALDKGIRVVDAEVRQEAKEAARLDRQRMKLKAQIAANKEKLRKLSEQAAA